MESNGKYSIRFFLSWLTWPATQPPFEATSGPSVDGIAVYASEIKDGELFAYVPSEIATGKGGSLGGSSHLVSGQ